MPGPHAPWEALGREPRVHLLLFVHRVEGVPPGLHALARRPGVEEDLREASRDGLEWRPVPGAPEDVPLRLLEGGSWDDVAARVSCDQPIAGEGFFSLGMVAELRSCLEAEGPAVYRELFRECGMIGQMLYLEAEAAGWRSTGKRPAPGRTSAYRLACAAATGRQRRLI